MDGSLLGDSLLSLDKTEPKLCSPLCLKKCRAFATVQALQQHMISLAHCDKVYYCLSNLLLVDSSRVETKRGKEKQFTTLSGLA